MSWTNPKGFNFRATAGYVTDGTNEIGELGGGYPYSVTIDSDTFNIGWTTTQSASGRDRNNAIDRRLAGINGRLNGGVGVTTFRVTLPAAGGYTIRLAMGDAGFSKVNFWRILDNGSPLDTFSGVATSAGQWADATGAVRTSASDWVSNNLAKTYTFATTSFALEMGDPAQVDTNDTSVAHLQIVQATQAPRSYYMGGLIEM